MGLLGPYGKSKEEILENFEKYTVAVYGFGKMGQPIGGVFAKHGMHVIGVDIDKNVVSAVNSGKATVEEPIELDGKTVSLSEAFKKFVSEGRLEAMSNAIEAAKKADIHVIIVPTLLREGFYPDLSALIDVSKKIARGIKDGDLVIIESTVPPGTTRELVYPILSRSKKKFGLVYSPERTYSGRVTFDIEERYPKLIGSEDEKAREAAAAIYGKIAKKGVIELPSCLEAEVAKVFEGIYRDVNIALANELAAACEELGCDYHRVRLAANSQPYSHLHLPGAGVGGHCIPVYPRFLIHSLKNREAKLTRLSREINRYEAPKHVVDLTLRASLKAKIFPRRILLVGLAYRGNVKELRYSPTLRLIEEFSELDEGITIYLFDPLRTKKEISKLSKHIEPLKKVRRYYISSVEEAVERVKKNVKVIVLVTNHKETEEFLEKLPSDFKGVIVDARVADHKDTLERLREKFSAGDVVYAKIGSKPVRISSSLP